MVKGIVRRVRDGLNVDITFLILYNAREATRGIVVRVCTVKCLLKDVIDFQVVRAMSGEALSACQIEIF